MHTETTARSVAEQEVHWEDFLWALGAVCELRNLPFDGEQFLKQFPPPYSIAQLIAVLHAQGVPVRAATTDALRTQAGAPYLAFQRADQCRPDDPQRKVAIIAKCDRRHALAINALSQGAFAVPHALLNEVFEPLVLQFPMT